MWSSSAQAEIDPQIAEMLELAKQLGKRQPGLQNDGLQPRQLLPLQGTLLLRC